ncbi:hypothetical protein, partial [endosymbiont of Lamellibrachia barhami]|uniref:hypothetical protein n=1 Tax=endosymbiont of Lamellibrachia barhami TaxID=205975 RepID=UPI001C4BB49D
KVLRSVALLLQMSGAILNNTLISIPAGESRGCEQPWFLAQSGISHGQPQEVVLTTPSSA